MHRHGTSDSPFTVDHAGTLLPYGLQAHQLQLGTQSFIRRGYTLATVGGRDDLYLVLLCSRVQHSQIRVRQEGCKPLSIWSIRTMPVGTVVTAMSKRVRCCIPRPRLASGTSAGNPMSHPIVGLQVRPCDVYAQTCFLPVRLVIDDTHQRRSQIITQLDGLRRVVLARGEQYEGNEEGKCDPKQEIAAGALLQGVACTAPGTQPPTSSVCQDPAITLG